MQLPALPWPASTPWPRTISLYTSQRTSSELCHCGICLRLRWLPALPAPHHPLSPSECTPSRHSSMATFPQTFQCALLSDQGTDPKLLVGTCTHRTHQCIVMFTNHSNTKLFGAAATSTPPLQPQGMAAVDHQHRRPRRRQQQPACWRLECSQQAYPGWRQRRHPRGAWQDVLT